MVRARREQSEGAAPASQTLDRGLSVLEHIAFADGPVSLAELAGAIGVHKSIVYRLVRTLEARGFVRVTGSSRYEPNLHLGRLGAQAFRPLQTAARPQMQKLADALGHTIYVMVRELEELVTVAIEEPTRRDAIAYRPSLRHPIDIGAASYGWLMAQPPSRDDRPPVVRARELGYAESTGEVMPGLSGVAAPIVTPGGECIGVLCTVLLDRDADTGQVGRRLLVGAHIIGEAFA